MKSNLLADIQWSQVGIVLGIFAAIAAVLVVCILLVAKFCKTNADEKVEHILSHLAGANCGGCGCSGCAGFAEKLAKGEAKLSDCHVTEAEEKWEALRLLCQRLAPDHMDEFEASRSALPRTTIWKITAGTITGKANRK